MKPSSWPSNKKGTSLTSQDKDTAEEIIFEDQPSGSFTVFSTTGSNYIPWTPFSDFLCDSCLANNLASISSMMFSHSSGLGRENEKSFANISGSGFSLILYAFATSLGKSFLQRMIDVSKQFEDKYSLWKLFDGDIHKFWNFQVIGNFCVQMQDSVVLTHPCTKQRNIPRFSENSPTGWYDLKCSWNPHLASNSARFCSFVFVEPGFIILFSTLGPVSVPISSPPGSISISISLTSGVLGTSGFCASVAFFPSTFSS